MHSATERSLRLVEASRRACEDGETAALFVDCTGGGWSSGSFLLTEPEEIVEVFESPSLHQEGSPFEELGRAVEARPDLVWAGFIAYDAGRCIEMIPNMAVRDRDIPLLGFAGYGRVEPIGVALSGEPASSTAGAPGEAMPYASGDLPASWSQSLERSEFERAVEAALEHIRSGDFYQVNLARRITAPAAGEAPAVAAESFEYLCRVVLPPRGCLLRWGDTFVVSASPELFLSVGGREVVTRPIKGTRPRVLDDRIDYGPAELASSAKERAENVMIVDLLRNDLGKVAEFGSVRVLKLFEVESFATVHHLVSTVTCTLREDASLADLLGATFPGGSVTGAPKVAAMRFIEAVEVVRRGVYTGAIGYIDPSGRLPGGQCARGPLPRMELNVAIRTLVLYEGCWDLWVGGGIVADSDPAAEWQETVDKSRGLAGVLWGIEAPTGPRRPSTY